jgi:ABC-type ATPase involved in cell division
VLIASHDLALVERFGVRRVILEGGRVAGGTGEPPPGLPSRVAV